MNIVNTDMRQAPFTTNHHLPLHSLSTPHLSSSHVPQKGCGGPALILAETTDEVATLFLEEDGLGICTYTATGTNSWMPDYVCGDALPLHITAPGKAILARLEPDRIDEIVSQHGLPSATDSTISSRQQLETELRSIQENEIAFSREEQSEGVVGVGTSFGFNERAPAAAIGVCGPLERLSGRYLQEDITGQVLSTAKSIQVELTK